MYCNQCGNHIPDDAVFCPFCRSKIQGATPPKDEADTEMPLSEPAGVSVETEEDRANEFYTHEIKEAEASVDTEEDPGETGRMSAPETPETPETPEAPEVPEAPEAPEVPETPEVFETSQTAPVGEKVSAGKRAAPKKRKRAVFAGVAVIVAAAVLIPVFLHIAKQRTYNEGVALFEQGKYSEALETFTSLGSFDDSEEMAARARMEMDYLEVNALAAAGKYDRVVEILRAREEFYRGSDVGREARVLADEYTDVAAAVKAKNAGRYEEAREYFEKLDLLREDFLPEICLCRAHQAEQEQQWMEILVQLYAFQTGDPELSFLDAPDSDEDMTVFDAYHSEQYEPFLAVLSVEGAEAEALKAAAENGFMYDEAKECLDFGQYAAAMEKFEQLGAFLDSEARYEEAKKEYEALEKVYRQAEEYFDNGEFYKAEKLYLSISDYEDSQEKADACRQPLPENGSYKIGNGSATSLEITAPAGSDCVFLRIYDSSGAVAGQVFIRPGKKATVNLKGGNYTMKVAYGTEWYGEIDLFGGRGSYQQLLNGSSTVFDLEGGYTYTLKLLSSVDGNVGSRSVGGADDM